MDLLAEIGTKVRRNINDLSEQEQRIYYLARQMARENDAWYLTEGSKNVMKAIFKKSAMKKLQELRNEGVDFMVESHTSPEGYRQYDRFMIYDYGYFYDINEIEDELKEHRRRVDEKVDAQLRKEGLL